jgi:predicted Zn finger-like uncharacterized protein
MFTVCPGCTRQFQIYAEHLAAASGQVRCGFCHEQFNAMERLHDDPLPNEKVLNDIQLGSELEPELEQQQETKLETEEELEPELEVEPQFDILEIAEPKNTDLEQDVLISTHEIDTNQELETAISEIGIRSPDEETGIEVKKAFIETEKNEPVENTHYDFPNDVELLQEEADKRSDSWILPVLWTTASFLALLIIFLQLIWFNRDRVLLEYPELIPYAKQLCKELNCRLIRQRDTRAIKLVNRDVRLHPDYQDALLVNAAMKNELPTRQPYPRVQLTLFDTSGSLLGYREFEPDDYLDSSIEIDKGMPINSPVYFVLEVSGPTAGAVSFEFRFL